MKNSNYLILIITFILFLKLNCQEEKEFIEFSNEHNDKYLWGTYKPNLYYAVKQKKNVTPVFGLMWYSMNKNTNNNIINKPNIEEIMRHECDQKKKIEYYWPDHNAVDYNNEIIIDKEENIKYDIKNIKTSYKENEQSWSVLINSKILENNNKKRNSLILYFTLENYSVNDKAIFEISKIKDIEYEINLSQKGNNNEKFLLKILNGQKNIKNLEVMKFAKVYTQTWNIKKIICNEFKKMQSVYIQNNETYSFLKPSEQKKLKKSNIVAIQISYDNDLDILVQYTNNINSNFKERKELENIMKEKITEFNSKFDKVFKINMNSNDKNFSKFKQMSKEALTNLLGGIGYFYGNIKVKNEEKSQKQKEIGLFTATPCRSYFARGFLWDEGFHQLIISKWDLGLSLEMVNSWFETMDENGWIPREQIRGQEAENQVPHQFIDQNNLIANPPSLILVLNNFIENYKYLQDLNTDYKLKDFLKKFYKKVDKWLQWYEKTQSKITKNGLIKYQWSMRDNEHNYPSGFDDLPRAMIFNEDENHLDLNIWLLQMEKSLLKFSNFFDKESIKLHEDNIKSRIKNIEENLYDKDLKIYSDFCGKQFKKIKVPKFPREVFPILWRNDGQCNNPPQKTIQNHIGTDAECNPYSENYCCSQFGWCGNTDQHCYCPQCKISEKLEKRRKYKKLKETYNPHIGYINLFPLFFGDFIFKKVKNIIKFLQDKDELYSDYGIRSLSKNDLLYHAGDDYWRGNIWIQLNYLTLKGLYKYSKEEKDNKDLTDLYNSLRNNVINSVFKNWEKNHVFYEVYSDITGEGLKNNPFNGWTSTILLILSEQYE